MNNNVSRAFSRWLTSHSAVRATSTFVLGRPVIITTTVTFKGVVQNATPKDLLVLPEGDRTTEAIKIHTTTYLKDKDAIVYKGSTYLVGNVAHRYIGNYHKVIALKQGRL